MHAWKIAVRNLFGMALMDPITMKITELRLVCPATTMLLTDYGKSRSLLRYSQG